MNKFWLVGICALGFTACKTTVSQTKVALADDHDHVTREDALNVLPRAICKKYSECDGIGPGKKYASAQDCETDERAKWSKVWGDDSCGGKKVLAGKLKECESRASTWACGNNVLDFGALLTECGSSSVCK